MGDGNWLSEGGEEKCENEEGYIQESYTLVDSLNPYFIKI